VRKRTRVMIHEMHSVEIIQNRIRKYLHRMWKRKVTLIRKQHRNAVTIQKIVRYDDSAWRYVVTVYIQT
jgi:hypothetical protein